MLVMKQEKTLKRERGVLSVCARMENNSRKEHLQLPPAEMNDSDSRELGSMTRTQQANQTQMLLHPCVSHSCQFNAGNTFHSLRKIHKDSLKLPFRKIKIGQLLTAFLIVHYTRKYAYTKHAFFSNLLC